jgi:signal peptidase I
MRGDVVVFRLPRDTSQTYVKRVIGLPGDRVQMKDGRLFLNGAMLPLVAAGQGRVEESDGVSHAIGRYTETLPGGARHTILKSGFDGLLDNTEEFTVPPFHIFVMGDNRDNSLDSRVPAEAGGVGFVPMENLMARAEVTLGSVDYLNAHSPLDWLKEIRASRFFKAI